MRARVRRLRDAAARAGSRSASARESAAARGVDVARAERVALVSASLATGAAVSLGGPVLLRRHHRAAPGPAAGRRRPPARAAGVGALRRVVPRRLRPARPDGLRARRAAGRHRHGDPWSDRSSYGSCSDAPIVRRAARARALCQASCLAARSPVRLRGGHAHHLHHPRHDRDALCHGRRGSRRRRRQLRSLSA